MDILQAVLRNRIFGIKVLKNDFFFEKFPSSGGTERSFFDHYPLVHIFIGVTILTSVCGGEHFFKIHNPPHPPPLLKHTRF